MEVPFDINIVFTFLVGIKSITMNACKRTIAVCGDIVDPASHSHRDNIKGL